MPPSIPSGDHASPTPTTPPASSTADARAASDTSTNNGGGRSAGPKPSPAPIAVPKHRPRANSRKEPTLLTDFLRGKQSPARLAADRKRRQSIEMVKAELRQEMRQSSVRKLQQPGGVRDRVSKWQKAHAAAMAEGDPDDAATEPTDVAFNEDDQKSVTESDRIRIKFRRTSRSASKPKPLPDFLNGASSTSRNPSGEAGGPPPTSPPKKRVVSDEHWRKPKNRGSPASKTSPSSGRRSTGAKGLPSDFVRQSGASPLVSDKIKEWAAKIDVPDTSSPPPAHRSSRSRDARARSEGATSEMGDSASDITARWVAKRRPRQDDGIRVKPSRPKTRGGGGGGGGNNDDGIRVTPANSLAALDNDGIRVRPMSEVSLAGAPPDKETRVSRSRSKTTSDSGRLSLPSCRSRDTCESANLSQQRRSPSRKETPKIDDDEDGIEQSSRLDTPTKGKEAGQISRLDTPAKGKEIRQGKSKLVFREATSVKDEVSGPSDEQSELSGAPNASSGRFSSLASKSVADIPGEIPFGHSAFSELDLTIKGRPRSRPKRTKVNRNTSLKSVPKVLKKVVEEGKKMIHEMNEPPRQAVANQPPSIEKWLNNTVDPFVDVKPTDETAPQPAPADENKTGEGLADAAKPRRRISHGSKPSHPSAAKSPGRAAKETKKEEAAVEDVSDAAREPATPTSTGLKRSRATRGNSSPVKQSPSRRQLLGVLKEAFQGESSSLPTRLRSYQSSQERKLPSPDNIPEPLQIRKSAPSFPIAETASSLVDGDVGDGPPAVKLAAPRFRPPTTGDHELSTILSEGGSNAVDSDVSSHATRSTVTQSTLLTKDSASSASQAQHGPGLKRRLTKHSDLVSVLSLPDDSSVPDAVRSGRSRPSLRKLRGAPGGVTAQELLREFIDDESLYLRELKTLVDGVVPVLLSHVINGTNATELFGPSSSGQIPETVSKSVVNMGVALEKLKGAHSKAPVSDIRKMANWAHGVVPMYSRYLGAWRLGFDDVVVNLAPAADWANDQDSLLAALPRNEKGDIVDDDGERVAVAHLLKRPLIRVKQLTKLMRCVDTLVGSDDTSELVRDFESLQEKARRRCKEETARIVDEEAIQTDTSRCRDLGTLEALRGVAIDASRQVSAKDVFSLSLSHSNDQRLDCRVELVHRDNLRDSQDEGDLLIREVGESRRSYLLFPPVPMSKVSARTGDGHLDMVVMVRGTTRGRAWRELLTLTADDEDQILDWLDLLPLTPVPPVPPVPPTEPDPVTPRRCRDEQHQQLAMPGTPSPRESATRAAAAHGSPGHASPSPIARDVSTCSPTSATRDPPLRYRERAPVRERTPPTSPTPPMKMEREALEKTPTRDDYRASVDYGGRGRPLKESMRPDPADFQDKKQTQQTQQTQQSQAPNTTPFRPDGAPPPPIHRSLSTSHPGTGGDIAKSAPVLQPRADQPGSDHGLKRRGSSPLKHEYLPSDQSSTSEAYSTEGSEVESSDDDLESLDIPETELGVSIKDDASAIEPPQSACRFAAESECSLTPAHSASQVGLHGRGATPIKNGSRFLARISRWSDKGLWKDITSDTCSLIVTNGLIEAYASGTAAAASASASASAGDSGHNPGPPVVALDLTPLVLIRQSTAVDLEIRSSVQPHSKLYPSHSGGNFRFRCFAAADCYNLYMSVHQARLNNQKFIQLANDARFKSFGERRRTPEDEDDGDGDGDGDDDASSRRRRRRGWFGRKNSYRSSVRAPSLSHDGASTSPSSTPSASSFLRRLTGGGNLAFNLARSSVDRCSRAGGGPNSLYTSRSSSSSAGGTPPRSPSVSVHNSSQGGGGGSGGGSGDNLRIRLHLLVPPARWEDYGNCSLQIRRPPPGWRQALRANHGLEKRVTVTRLPRREAEQAWIVLDAVLGSGCFSAMGSRGIVCGVWEEVRNGDGVVGMVPETGATGGNIKKWCFQFASAAEANGVLRLVHQEVVRA
ncbi:uncharacterized protein UV8b_05945 [Ustilaginoidea virens]|uniref:SRm160/300 splicing coactivator n=1 Tax=Ustilaginoidea virens TaxID=1159556 RepID=A0A8E5HUF0_USTVR|nr:uncharacterized protein UV8b_05945 [Ustilaginoidea virens]QUC21702.1 hypothetical protein UV8b_05945 [Ustilaginoidea virens]